jgi:hypothetical protein
VVRAVGVDVGDGFVKGRDGFDADGEGEMLRVVVLGRDILDTLKRKGCNGGLAGLVNAKRNTLGGESSSNAGEDGSQSGILDEESLDGVAGSGIAGLGVDNGGDGLVLVCRGSEVDVAKTVCVAEDGNLCRLLDVADQIVGATGDDEVNVAILSKELGDDIAGGDKLDG